MHHGPELKSEDAVGAAYQRLVHDSYRMAVRAERQRSVGNMVTSALTAGLETIYIQIRRVRNGPAVPYAGTGVPRVINPAIEAGPWSALLGIVIDHAQSETYSAFQTAYTVTQAHPVESAAAFYGTISGSENENLP